MRIGLVLGAGGSVGVAYHGAVLSALADASGWDPRDADVVVGTSAGSITAAMLRAGVPAGDLRAISEGGQLSVEGTRLAQVGRPHRPRATAAHFLSMRPVADPVAVLRSLARLHVLPPAAFAAALMPAGPVPTEPISAGINAVHPDGWPTAPLWITAVELRKGRRVVFGQDGWPSARVGDAVAASCAIPGYFQPVNIAGSRYVDGGLRSFVNLDLVAGLGLDLVVVSSPMTSASAWPALAATSIMRQPLRARLHAEAASLRRQGTLVATIEPGRTVAAAMGLNPMDARVRGPVSRAAYDSTLRWLTGSSEGQKLARLLGSGEGGAAGAQPTAVAV